MKGNRIILEGSPKGKFMECVISGTPKPGTFMEIVGSTAPVGGRFTFRATTRNDGTKGPIVILKEDDIQGKRYSDAYVSGTVGFLYWPIAGEEFNAMYRYAPGTSTVSEENIGDLLEIDGATGMLQAVGSTGPTHVSAPFYLLEHLGVALTANAWVWVQYLGNQA